MALLVLPAVLLAVVAVSILAYLVLVRGLAATRVPLKVWCNAPGAEWYLDGTSQGLILDGATVQVYPGVRKVAFELGTIRVEREVQIRAWQGEASIEQSFSEEDIVAYVRAGTCGVVFSGMDERPVGTAFLAMVPGRKASDRERWTNFPPEVDHRRLVVTAAHVVDAVTDPTEVACVFRTSAGLVRCSVRYLYFIDRQADVALLVLNQEPPGECPPLLLEPRLPRVGTEVGLVGNPRDVAQFTVIFGRVSAANLAGKVQVNAAVEPGCSGGPVFKVGSGAVVGITSSKFLRVAQQGLAAPASAVAGPLREWYRDPVGALRVAQAATERFREHSVRRVVANAANLGYLAIVGYGRIAEAVVEETKSQGWRGAPLVVKRIMATLVRGAQDGGEPGLAEFVALVCVALDYARTRPGLPQPVQEALATLRQLHDRALAVLINPGRYRDSNAYLRAMTEIRRDAEQARQVLLAYAEFP